MPRTHPDNCAWVLCCCGCLPIIGSIKGALLVGPITAFFVVSNTLIACLIYPLHIFNAYYSFVVSGRFGCNLKILSVLLLPIPLAMYPAVVVLGSVLVGIGVGFGNPLAKTFEERYDLVCGGMGEAIKWAGEWAVDFWNWNWHTAFEEFSRFRNYRGDSFDIPFYQIFISLFISACGLIICLPIFTIICTLKLIPTIFSWEAQIFSLYGRELGRNCALGLMVFPLFVLGVVLAPVGAIFAWTFGVMMGACCGLYTAIDAYQDGVGAAFWKMWDYCDHMDKESGKLMELKFWGSGGCRVLCCGNPFECCKGRGQGNYIRRDRPRADIVPDNDNDLVAVRVDPDVINVPPANNNNNAGNNGGAPGQLQRQPSWFGHVDVSHIWESFFNMCEVHMRTALDEKQIKADDVAGMEPFVLLGIPSLTILKALIRSYQVKCPGILLADGIEVNNQNRPHNSIGDMFYQPCVKAKNDLAKLNPSELELQFIEHFVFIGSVEGKAPEKFNSIAEDRKAALAKIGTQVNAMSINVSRLPQFRRTFGQIVDRLADYVPGSGAPAAQADRKEAPAP